MTYRPESEGVGEEERIEIMGQVRKIVSSAIELYEEIDQGVSFR